MILDAKFINTNTIYDADICIIGAGAAGITLALEFKKTPLKIILLESGNLKSDPDTQKLYHGENTGDLINSYQQYLYISRLRYFGGSTNHWAGFCRPLDAIDFEKRSWIPYSGWPITKEQLDPYYKRATSYLGIKNFQSDQPSFMKDSKIFIGKEFHIASKLRFGQYYLKDLQRSSNIQLILNANVSHIRLNQEATYVNTIEVQSLLKNIFFVKAKQYILASGGIENARLLLLSNDVCKNGIGNSHDLVGRFFMEHPHVPVGGIFFFNDFSNLYRYQRHYRFLFRHDIAETLCLSDEAMRHFKILNINIQLLRRFLRLQDGHLIDQSSELVDPNESSFPLQESEYLDFSKNIESNSQRYVFLKARIEQVPNPDSRVTLSTKKDILNLPKTSLDWKVSNIDKESLVHTIKLLGQELGGFNLGRLNVNIDTNIEWPKLTYPGSHHIGTTRMSSNIKEGVVNANCRVHDIANLYISGSSVFPTGGAVNPTFTIIAMAIRLADFLKSL